MLPDLQQCSKILRLIIAKDLLDCCDNHDVRFACLRDQRDGDKEYVEGTRVAYAPCCSCYPEIGEL
jgi:hypothetical protein